MIKQYRPTWVEINLDNTWFNYQQAQKKIASKTIIPVLKADAYGHGAVMVMKHLYQKGVRVAAVSLLEEALELRDVFSDIDILMMGPIMKEDLVVAASNNIEITIYDLKVYDWIKTYKGKLKCQLIIDSGMSRYGFTKTNDIVYVVDELNRLTNIELKGIYTHFSTANDNKAFYEKQLKMFKSVLEKLNQIPPMVHISNSSSTFKYEKDYDFTTHVRLGISLHGMVLDEKKPALKPVMTFCSKVVQLKHLKKGDCVGYGATYQASEDEIIAILPVGYADGFHRHNKKGEVEINNKLYKIVGNICMDACFVKVDNQVNIGDIAVLFGGIVSIDEVAMRVNSIQHEVCTSISYRVPRIYVKGD